MSTPNQIRLIGFICAAVFQAKAQENTSFRIRHQIDVRVSPADGKRLEKDFQNYFDAVTGQIVKDKITKKPFKILNEVQWRSFNQNKRKDDFSILAQFYQQENPPATHVFEFSVTPCETCGNKFGMLRLAVKVYDFENSVEQEISHIYFLPNGYPEVLASAAKHINSIVSGEGMVKRNLFIVEDLKGWDDCDNYRDIICGLFRSSELLGKFYILKGTQIKDDCTLECKFIPSKLQIVSEYWKGGHSQRDLKIQLLCDQPYEKDLGTYIKGIK